MLGTLVATAAIATSLSTMFRALVLAQQSQRMAINGARAYYAAASGAHIARAYWAQIPMDSQADQRFAKTLPETVSGFCPDLGLATTLCLSRSPTYLYALARMPGGEQRLFRWRAIAVPDSPPVFAEEHIFLDL